MKFKGGYIVNTTGWELAGMFITIIGGINGVCYLLITYRMARIVVGIIAGSLALYAVGQFLIGIIPAFSPKVKGP
jgi:hypothetical protein